MFRNFKSSLLATFASLLVAREVGAESPVVTLSYGSVRGRVEGLTAKFLGMPFAAPPTGNRRFGFPEPPEHFNVTFNATEFGPSCPQQAVKVPDDSPFQFPHHDRVSEDCLYINVFRPADMSHQSLPVLFWIPGGGFQIGGSAIYPGDGLINRSLALGEPILLVTSNYRLNAFGFLAGKEVKEKGLTNIGLRDQRFALQWVHDNIACFGGDPSRVTIWGESAGSISVGFQLLLNGGNPSGLFSAAIMESGSPGRSPQLSAQQGHFDNLVTSTNCSDAPDRFECLRQAPFAALQSAIDASPSLFSFQSLNLSWLPVVDGDLIPENPLKLVECGKYAKVPIIIGDDEDQGTLFSQTTLNITTDAQFTEYIKTNYLNFVTDEQLKALKAVYPEDATQGSPFGTGTSNAKTPEYKRIAALVGDMVFQAPRRAWLEAASKTQPAYSYRYARNGKFAPTYGTFHGIELAYFFSFTNNQTDYVATDAIVYFVNTYNPNPPTDSISLLRNTHWPMWGDSECCPPLLSFFDSMPVINITEDTYRREGMRLLKQLLLL